VKASALLQPAEPWTGDTWAGRIDQSASMLFLHGYISMSQRAKIGKKLEKQIQGALLLCQDEGCPNHGTDHVCVSSTPSP